MSKRPSINSLIHFYKRCVSARLGTLSQSFIQDQRRSTKHKVKNISRCYSSKLFQETCIQRLAVWKRCDLLVQFLFSTLMASDLIILCLDLYYQEQIGTHHHSSLISLKVDILMTVPPRINEESSSNDKKAFKLRQLWLKWQMQSPSFF